MLFYLFVRPGSINGLLLGMSLYYIIDNKKYHHLPFCIITTPIYCGYQILNNKNKIKEFLKKEFKM